MTSPTPLHNSVRAYVRRGARNPEPVENDEPYEQLPLLPGSGLIDLAALRMKRESLKARARQSESTRRVYSSHFRNFSAWCQQTGKTALPATPDTLCLYVTWMITDQRYRINTVRSQINAIVDIHRRSGLVPPPIADALELILAVKRQRKEHSLAKTAMGVKDLVKACMLAAKGPDTNRSRRDTAILILGFATGLRRSNIAALTLDDVSFRGEGLAVRIDREKNDQEGEGRSIAVWAGKRPETDPVRVLKRWLEVRGQWAGPLFCHITRRDVIWREAIGDNKVAEVVKNAAARVGLDPAGYGGHSLRSGALTAAADRGRTDRELMRFSGHKKSESLKSYIRAAEVFEARNPLPDVL